MIHIRDTNTEDLCHVLTHGVDKANSLTLSASVKREPAIDEKIGEIKGCHCDDTSGNPVLTDNFNVNLNFETESETHECLDKKGHHCTKVHILESTNTPVGGQANYENCNARIHADVLDLNKAHHFH